MNIASLRYLQIHFISLYFRSSHHFHSMFNFFQGLMNSINWPALHVWVFIAQLVEHCSTKAEVTGPNPVEAAKTIFWAISQLFKLCRLQLRSSDLHFIYIHSSAVALNKPVLPGFKGVALIQFCQHIRRTLRIQISTKGVFSQLYLLPKLY